MAENLNTSLLGGAQRAAPTSPWMPFSMLFAAISTKVSPQHMDLVNTHYEDFKVCFSIMLLSSHYDPSMFMGLACIEVFIELPYAHLGRVMGRLSIIKM